jgi:hypothetical protein
LLVSDKPLAPALDTNGSTNFMSFESFSRLSQAIKEAAESAEPEAVRKSAALVVNSVASMVTPKRRERTTAFTAAVDYLGDAIQAARHTKQSETKSKKADKPEAQKSLAELLSESAQAGE